MKTYTLTTELEVKFKLASTPPNESEVEYPTVEIEYRYSPGCPAVMYQRNGDPGWPAEPADVELIRARMINSCGLDPTPDQLFEWCEQYLDSDKGFEQACENARQLNEPDEPPERERDYP